MRKHILTIFTILLIPISAKALPVGNPWDASLISTGVFWNRGFEPFGYYDPYYECLDFFSIRIGFYGDYVFNRKFAIDAPGRGETISETRINTNGGFLALNLFHIADLYGVFGSTNLAFETPESAFGVADNRIYYLETNSNISFTAGARVTLFEFCDLAIGADGKYLYTRPRLNSGRREGGPVEYFSDYILYQEWQVSLGAAYRVPISSTVKVVPYAAVEWAHAKIDFDNLTNEPPIHAFPNLRTPHNFGYALGLTMVGWERWSATIEGRFINEFAFFLNIQFQI
ncbi:MAG: hypothetical protein JJU12_04805 [Chlamydiales bacterium]|nr:hypothetical protein [Chlamydiales bacterium]